ncbi:RNA-directed DNA polymerase, eukaryota, partial [Tanacetum coccineum]
ARSNVDHTRLISKSIFVTNFPDNTTSKDLWEVCKGYGTVVDVFIPDRKSKAGKRFAFVRFIKVDNVDRLVASSPAMVLDDECVVERDLDNFVMGEVKDFSSINNLRVLLSNEGFQHVRLAYLGGLWVMIELTSVQTKMRFMKHVGVASWFSQLCKAQPDFVSRERIVWIDIEGVPLHAWSRPTFSKIGSRWGEVIELEDNKEDCFARKRICIKTKLEDNILEKFKIIVRGKNFVIRAKSYCLVSDVKHRGDALLVERSRGQPVRWKRLISRFAITFSESVIWIKEDLGAAFDSGKDIEIRGNYKYIATLPEGGKIYAKQQEKRSKMIQRIRIRLDFKVDVQGEQETQEAEGHIQEIKLDCISNMDVKVLWGNYKFEYTISEAVGNSGGILCVWDPSVFRKEHHVVSDNFVALYGSWVSNQAKLLMVSIYAPQSITSKRSLWSYISSLISHWDGHCMIMGDFNEVRCMEDRLGSVYNAQGANEFNSFISNSGLVEIQLEGYSFTWSFQSAKKMSKLDRFFVSDGLLSLFPHLSGICLDRHLSDHRPILLREVVTDYGPSPFRVYHSWFSLQGFDQMVSETWNNIDLDDNNKMVRFKKKLQILKKEIRSWVNDCKKNQSGRLVDLRSKLCHIDKVIDQGGVNDDILLTRLDLLKKLHDIKSSDARDYMQKAKIQWAIEGDENSNFFHGIINRKRANLAIKGVMVDGEWVDDPCRVKEEFRLHFANRFRAPAANRCKLNYTFPNRLSSDQLDMLESPISRDEVRNAVWGCGENKSPGPDGFTFEFFRKFWDTLGSDFCAAVEWFFDHSSFSRGCNSSFIALIPKNHDPKFVNDYRPISLIGSLYKVVTKILATRLSSIISGLISDVQTAFLPNRQILDGPFIINELLSWCKHKKQQAMVFKVDFAKAYDSIRWDFLEDVLRAFGFGSKWCSWIRGCLHSGMASVLLNGSPTSEFQFHCGLKQGDPLAPYLFILIMESLHLSLSRAIEAGIFKGIKIGSSLNISHLFYADDAVFIGEWSIANLSGITHILHCFSLLSGLSINLKKSHLLGVGIRSEDVNAAALYFGCSTMKTPFKYLGVMVGGNSSTLQAWDDTIGKLKARLSNWKLKTLSVGGRLTLLKSVLGSTPIYNMSIYKVPKSVLQTMESIRRNFFNGVQCDERKIVWIKWAKVLASKKYGGLGVSSFYALNRALLFKWVWRFISRDNSLWCRLIMSMHGSSLYKLSPFRYSTWKSIIREVHMLKDRGVDLISHCHIRVGNGLRTQFWNEVWIGDTQLRVMFPRIYALEINKDCTVADKLQFSVTSSLRRSVRGGVESSQLALLQTYIEGTLLSNMEDRWVWDLNGEGVFRVKDVRILLDECFLPKAPTATRWVKYVPIKINVFAWKLRKIPRTCSSVADWLRISSGSYAAGVIYHGRPLVHMLIGLIGSIPSY